MRCRLSDIGRLPNVVGAAFAQRYAFFDDGSFLYGCSEFDGLERVRYEAGEWLVDGGYLVLAVRERLILTGGDLVEDDEFGDRLEGGEVWIETILYPTVEDVYRFAYGAWNRGRCAK